MQCVVALLRGSWVPSGSLVFASEFTNAFHSDVSRACPEAHLTRWAVAQEVTSDAAELGSASAGDLRCLRASLLSAVHPELVEEHEKRWVERRGLRECMIQRPCW